MNTEIDDMGDLGLNGVDLDDVDTELNLDEFLGPYDTNNMGNSPSNENEVLLNSPGNSPSNNGGMQSMMMDGGRVSTN